jgi:hypothetical protein
VNLILIRHGESEWNAVFNKVGRETCVVWRAGVSCEHELVRAQSEEVEEVDVFKGFEEVEEPNTNTCPFAQTRPHVNTSTRAPNP